jgi:hypothetical protein
MVGKQLQLYINRAELRFFLIPESTTNQEGSYTIHSLKEEPSLVLLDTIIQFEVSEEDAIMFLKQEYKKAIETTKDSLQNLNRFSVLTGNKTMTGIKDFLTNEANSFPDNEKEIFHQAKDLIQDIVHQSQQPELSEKESQKMFQNTFKKVPEILSYFEENKLKEAAKDPDAWANEMKERLFGDIEKKKKEESQKKLREEVRANIAARLKEAGVDPIDLNDM